MEADLSKLKVTELKEMLRSQGLKVSGRKSELIQRLSESKIQEPEVQAKVKVPPRKRFFDMSSLPEDKDALDKFIQSAPKDILFLLMLEVDPREIRIICESRNKKVRGICNDKGFQKAYWEKHRRKLMEGEIKVELKDKKFILKDKRGDVLKINFDLDNKIYSGEYIPNIGMDKSEVSFYKFGDSFVVSGPTGKGYNTNLLIGFPEAIDRKKWWTKKPHLSMMDNEKSIYANKKGVNEFISEVKDILRNVEYKGKNLSEYVKF